MSAAVDLHALPRLAGATRPSAPSASSTSTAITHKALYARCQRLAAFENMDASTMTKSLMHCNNIAKHCQTLIIFEFITIDEAPLQIYEEVAIIQQNDDRF